MRNIVIILDTSYSMGYLDTFDQAKKAVTEIANDLQPSDTSALIFTSSRAKIVKPLDPDTGESNQRMRAHR